MLIYEYKCWNMKTEPLNFVVQVWLSQRTDLSLGSSADLAVWKQNICLPRMLASPSLDKTWTKTETQWHNGIDIYIIHIYKFPKIWDEFDKTKALYTSYIKIALSLCLLRGILEVLKLYIMVLLNLGLKRGQNQWWKK